MSLFLQRIGSKTVIFTIVTVSMISLLCGCSKNEKSIQEAENIPSEKIFDLCEVNVREYLNLTTEKEMAKYLTINRKDCDNQKVIRIKWSSDGSDKYTVYLSDNVEFYNANTFEVISNKQQGFDVNSKLPGILIPGKKYYYKIISEKGCVYEDFIYTLDAPVRYISLNVGRRNIRDLGGWSTESKGKIRYGLLFRGAQLTDLDERDKNLLHDQLGIKTQIDLRYDYEANYITESDLGEDVKYIRVPFKPYGQLFFYTTFTAIREIFDVLSDSGNYPVYFHCAAGADRTGTFAYLINGLCGVSYEDLTKDFEITSFSPSGLRARGKIIEGGFSEDGIMQDDSGNYVAWGQMYMTNMKYFATESGKLSDAIENFLVHNVKVPIEQVESVKNIMIAEG